MAIPVEQGLVKQFTATLPAGSTDPVTISYSVPGGIGDVDLSPQIQGQGVAIFVDNPADTQVSVDVYTTVTIYGESYKAFVGSFTVGANAEGGMVTGFGVIKKGLEIQVTPATEPGAAADVVIAVVPSNG